jgi:hypothetical protein|tara:strand:+ start:746 stop:955 length:210 start_codon:yes stop_codon:yes gene_type:complete
MENTLDYIERELKKLDRCIVATPTEEYLERFAKANHGANDLLLMQLGKNFGYQLALIHLRDELLTNKNQ